MLGVAALILVNNQPLVAQQLVAMNEAPAGVHAHAFPAHNSELFLLPNIPQPCTLMFHGLTREEDALQGTHQLRVRIYNALGNMLNEQKVSARLSHGAYDVTLTNVPPALRMRTEQFTLGIAIDNNVETLWPIAIKHAREFESNVFIAYVDAARLEKNAVEIADRADRDSEAAHNNRLAVGQIDPMNGNVKIKTFEEYAGEENHVPPSVRLELGFAGTGVSYSPQAMMDYGRGTIEVRNIVKFLGSKLGLGARLMRLGNNFHYAAGGIVADVNNDGSVIATIGVASYQAGSDPSQANTISPFSRLQYFSSPKGVFFYSELEATVHLHGYLSGTAGIGFAFSRVEIAAGYHYSMYTMPDAMSTQSLNGINTMVNFSF